MRSYSFFCACILLWKETQLDESECSQQAELFVITVFSLSAPLPTKSTNLPGIQKGSQKGAFFNLKLCLGTTNHFLYKIRNFCNLTAVNF